LAKAAVEGGKVHLESSRVKPSKEVQVGQQLEIRRGDTFQVVIIETLSEQRGSATVAQTLYTETPESIEQREVRKSVRRMERAGLNIPSSKPDKKNRRALAQLKDLDRNWQHSPDD
jgi:ribosome-associated heat shock protein Hsp15